MRSGPANIGACLLSAVLAAAACAPHVIPAPVAPVPAGDIVTSIFLLGDAGTAHHEPDPNLLELTRQATASPRGSVIVFLGDNLYPKGMPAESSSTRAEAERRLEVQLDVVRKSQRRAIFLAGNHDWERWGQGGQGAIDRVSEFTLGSAGRRHVIVAGHHPLASGGKHGGYWSIGKHIFPLRDLKRWLWIPLPVIGSIYPIARMNGITNQDLSNSRNEYRRAQLGKAFAAHPSILYAAGHDHNLQVFRGPYAKSTMVSGSGIVDHQDAVRYKSHTLYAARKPGFMRFDVDRSGRVRLSVQVINKTGPAEHFAIWLTEP